MDRLTQIRDLIDRANHAYYNSGAAILEDATYDALKDEIRLLAPADVRLAQVGAAVVRDSIRQKRQHAIPMGSQNKADSKAKFLKWVDSLGLPPDTRWHANLKLDGGSNSFDYVAGGLFQAVTRGNGVEGEDITANALLFANTPKRVLLRGEPFTGYVRAEVVLPVEAWKLVDPEMSSNPRNFGNGIAGRKDGSDAQHLWVVAFRAYDARGKEIAATETGMEEALREMGFATSPSVTGSAEEVWAFFEATKAKRNTLPQWIDGLVVKIDDIALQSSFGESSGCPNGQIALKFPAEGARTVIRSVEITVGHTGAVIPTAQFDPVPLGGTTVAAATLHNWDEINALDVAVGDTVLVEKRGDVIPAVVAVLDRPEARQPIAEPAVCPCCGGALERRTTLAGDASAHLYCANGACPSRVLGKIKRWAKSLNILGLGPEVISALVAQMGVKDAGDLYWLRDDLVRMAAVEVSPGIRLGEKRAIKILHEIDATRELTISEFFGSLGVDSLGKRRVELIQRAVPGQMDTVEDWMNGKLLAIAPAAGVPEVAPRLVAELAKKRDLVDRLLAGGVKIKAEVAAPVAVANANAKSFCITGALSQPKGHFQALMEAKGHTYKDSVAKGLDYLVMADPASASSKAERARKLGVKCISEAELLALLG